MRRFYYRYKTNVCTHCLYADFIFVNISKKLHGYTQSCVIIGYWSNRKHTVSFSKKNFSFPPEPCHTTCKMVNQTRLLTSTVRYIKHTHIHTHTIYYNAVNTDPSKNIGRIKPEIFCFCYDQKTNMRWWSRISMLAGTLREVLLPHSAYWRPDLPAEWCLRCGPPNSDPSPWFSPHQTHNHNET